MSDLASMWSRHREQLLKALEVSEGFYCERDIVDGLILGDYRFFEGERSAIVANVHEYPRCKSVNIFLAAGELDELIAMEKDVIEWGRAQGCDRVEWAGRRGWLKKLEGYTILCTMAFKEI